ncbi:DUF4886 domain-containing protein [Dongia sp.]|uniref:DUF4886 domain-containing protein n=1 Tax=Dongia sp. TaxID=1977262 RepID=UPI0037512F58
MTLRNGLIVALAIALSFLAVLNAPRFGGRYILSDWDRDAVMHSGETPQTARTITILFVGNSFTSGNDLAAMLVNIAAADPGNPVQLSVKAVTYPGADLRSMLKQTDALAWAQANRPDYVVLQERSLWYSLPRWVQQARENALDWNYALSPLKAQPILFETWPDLDGAQSYTDRSYCCYGKTFKEMSAEAQRATAALAQELGMPVVRVARSYSFAVQAGATDLYQRDLHHASYAGTYLAALTFYRYFTHRSGAETTYRPFGMSAAAAAVLVQAVNR